MAPQTDQERAIDAFIPAAVKEADKKIKARIRMKRPLTQIRPGAEGKDRVHNYWTEYFHQEMNNLTRAAGIRI